MLVNNSNFIINEVPSFNPFSLDFSSKNGWWGQEKRKCIEGVWSCGKWMPGVVYFYVNFWKIKLTIPGSKQEIVARPFLRDLEWEKGYLYTEAKGFSGFSGDDEYSCNRLLLLSKEELEEELLSAPAIIKMSLYNSRGELKKYISAREYLRKNHGESKGKPVYLNEARNIIDIEARGGGKDLEENTLIYTKKGPIKIKDVQIGQKIYGADGKLTTVISKKYFNDQMQYRVTFSDGRSLLCGGGHLWTVWRKQRNGDKKITLELNDILKDYKIGKRGDSRYYVDICKPIKYGKKKLPIDPYFLGLWLGDGHSNTSTITTTDEEIVNYLKQFAKQWNLDLVYRGNYSYSIVNINGKGKKNPLLEALKQLNLIRNKHIPEKYLYSSVEQRLALLQGLMDSDGYADDRHIELTTSYEGLKNTIPTLIHSLGIRTKIRTKKTACKPTLRISLLTDLPIFRLSRKLKFVGKNNSKYAKTNRTKSGIVKIEPVSVMPSVCIGVDNKDSLFVAGDYIVTHNSYFSSCVIYHNFVFDGATDYDEYLEAKANKNYLTSSTLVGAIDAKYSNDLLNKVELGVDNLIGGVNYNGIFYPCPLKKSTIGNLGLNTKNPYTSAREVKMGNTWQTIGSMSNILHRSFADNPHAGTGTRPNLIMLEEVGLFHNLIESLGALRDTYTKDLRQFGVVWMFGTGGAMASGASMAAEEVFNNPEAYYCLSFVDIYEGRKNPIGYFVPKHMTLNEFKDENGNTIEELAKKKVEKDRQSKASGKNKNKIISSLDRQNNPEKPSEAFEVPDASYFPTLEIKDHLVEVKNNPDKYLDINYVGKFKYSSLEDSYDFETVQDLVPIRTFPLKEKVEGACEMFEPPAKDNKGQITSFRFIAGIDPYDKDSSTTDSLGSIFILDRFTDKIVFEYTGRPERSNLFYEVCRRALLFYNGIAMYESNLSGLYGYFEKKNCLHLLADTPENMRDSATWKEGTNTSKGIPGTEANNRRGREFLDNWLREPLMDGTDRIKVHSIRSVGLLEELSKWNTKGNFDRVSAMGILMWYRQTFPEFNYNEDYENTKKTSKFGEEFSRYKSKKREPSPLEKLQYLLSSQQA
jgi:hypothetical protein